MNQGDGAAFPMLTRCEPLDYEEIARKYEAINDFDNAEKYYKLANTPSARQALGALFARVTEATFLASRIFFHSYRFLFACYYFLHQTDQTRGLYHLTEYYMHS